MDSKDPLILTIRDFHRVIMEHSIEDFSRWLKDNQISRSQIGILMFLHRQNESQISVLGQELGVSTAAVSQIIDRLFQMGFIVREEIPGDRRTKSIKLSAEGKAIVKQAHAAHLRWMEPLQNEFSQDEKDEIIKALKLLTSGAKKFSIQKNI
jgi:DNA-binding MarR family transcriptional regulator